MGQTGEHQSFLRRDDDDQYHGEDGQQHGDDYGQQHGGDDDGGGDVQDAESLADETADSAKIWVGRARNRGKHRRIQMFIGRCKNQSTLSGAFLQQNKHDARFIEFVKYT